MTVKSNQAVTLVLSKLILVYCALRLAVKSNWLGKEANSIGLGLVLVTAGMYLDHSQAEKYLCSHSSVTTNQYFQSNFLV